MIVVFAVFVDIGEGCSGTDCVILLEGSYPGHLQDVFISGDSIWWAHTEYLVRTGRDGKVVRRSEVGGHHAGLAVKDGRLYVAVCAYNGEPRWRTTDACHVMVGEYDAWTLERIKMHVLEINDRAGSFCIMPDGSYLIGCLRHPSLKSTEVKFHHVDDDFKLIGTHVIDAGIPIELGIEVMRCEGDEIYLFLDQKRVVTLNANDFGLRGCLKAVAATRAFAEKGIACGSEALSGNRTRRRGGLKSV